MRLLFLASRDDSHPQAAGGDVLNSTYARHFAEAGHQVTYLTSSYPGARAAEWRDGVRFLRAGRAELLPALMFNYYRRHGQRFDVVYEEVLGGSRVPFCAPLYVRQPLLAEWYQINEPVFVHQLGRPLGTVLGRVERWLGRIHRKATILTPSEARRQDLIRFGFKPGQVLAVPPVAIDDAIGEMPDVADRSPAIVWLGKLRRYKCPHHAVEAMPEVLRECPDARLVIAGRRDEESYLKELRELIRRLGISQSVEFAFDLSEEEKTLLLARARALVVTSPVEGFGIVILEAAVQGTPAVVSDGVPEEVVAHGQNGLRVAFGDTQALAAALSAVLRSNELHATLAVNAVEHARRFSRAALQSGLDNALRHAVSGRLLREALV